MAERVVRTRMWRVRTHRGEYRVTHCCVPRTLYRPLFWSYERRPA